MSNLDLTIAEIMHGDTQVLKIMKGDVQKWPYVSLPYDAEVEYLQSDGTAYIDTGILTKSTLTFVIELYMPQSASSVWPFGGRVSASSGNVAVNYRADTNKWRWRYAGRNVDGGSPSLPGEYVFDNTGNAHDIVITPKGGNPLTLTLPKNTFTTNYNFYLFACNNAGSTTNVMSGMKIYSVKIYDGGTLVRDYIPVRNNGVGYLYDSVNGTLLGNAIDNGAFIYGNDV